MTVRKGWGWKAANTFTLASAVMVLALQVFGSGIAAASMMVAYSTIWFLRMCMDCLANDGDVDGMRFGEELAATRSAMRAMEAGDRALLACSGAAWVIAFSIISAVSMAGWGAVRPGAAYAVSAIILIVSGAAFLAVTQGNHRIFTERSMNGRRGSDIRSALSVIGGRTIDEGKTE